MPKLSWNDDKDRELMQHKANGLSFAEIAVRMKVSRSAVAGRCKRLGLVDGEEKRRTKQRACGVALARKFPRMKQKKVSQSAVAKAARSARAALGLPLHGALPPRPDPLFECLLIERNPLTQCPYIEGSATYDAVCCGMPMQEGEHWCGWHTMLCASATADAIRHAPSEPSGQWTPDLAAKDIDDLLGRIAA